MNVFDSSALLAMIFDEPGAAKVSALLAENGGLVSAVNLAEVISKLQDNSLNSNHAFGLLYDHFVQLVTNMLLVCQLRFEIDQTLFRFFCRSWIMVWHGSVVLSEEISGHRLA